MYDSCSREAILKEELGKLLRKDGVKIRTQHLLNSK